MARPGFVPACPVCRQSLPGAISEWPQFPFCTPRCRLIDLGRWLDERYTRPAGPRTTQEMVDEIETLEARRLEEEAADT